tara:strand:+ start:1035 stop:1421 length:387 start_codon:yes stop_codon:yes gene_type:complete
LWELTESAGSSDKIATLGDIVGVLILGFGLLACLAGAGLLQKEIHFANAKRLGYTPRATGTYTSPSRPTYGRSTSRLKPIIDRPTDREMLSDPKENPSSAQTSVNCSRCGSTLIPGRYYCGGCGRYTG